MDPVPLRAEVNVFDLAAGGLVHAPGKEAVDQVDEGLPGTVVACYPFFPLGSGFGEPAPHLGKDLNFGAPETVN